MYLEMASHRVSGTGTWKTVAMYELHFSFFFCFFLKHRINAWSYLCEQPYYWGLIDTANRDVFRTLASDKVLSKLWKNVLPVMLIKYYFSVIWSLKILVLKLYLYIVNVAFLTFTLHFYTFFCFVTCSEKI